MKIKKDFNPKKLFELLTPVEINPDTSYLTDKQKNIIDYLIEVANIIDEIYLLQKNRANLVIKEKIRALNDPNISLYFKVMSGPFDGFNDNIPFIEGVEYSDKAGFYPEDLTVKEFEDFLLKRPELKDDIISPYTVIVREQDGSLKAVKYCDIYKNYLQKAGDALMKASEIAENPSVKSYLQALFTAFQNNDFYNADIRWLQLVDNDIESIIGPHEFYDDKFMGYKASFTAFIALKNRTEFKKLKTILKLLDTLQQSLPIPEHYKKNIKSSNSQIQVINLIYAGGDARGPVQTAAFNLPNSHKVKSEFGSKKALIYNVMEAKFNTILKPIANKFLDEKDSEKVTFAAYFNFILMHEISHELGIGVIKDEEGNPKDISYFLKNLYSTIEETKADVMGMYLTSYLLKNCFITDCSFIEAVVTYMMSLFRSMRFGKENVHCISNIIQWNFLRKEEVFIPKSENKFSIDLHKFEKVVEKLLTIILTLQAEGSYKKSKEFIEEYSYIDDELKSSLDLLVSLPIDILPIYSKTGEKL